jgi:hypothetical protein
LSITISKKLDNPFFLFPLFFLSLSFFSFPFFSFFSIFFPPSFLFTPRPAPASNEGASRWLKWPSTCSGGLLRHLHAVRCPGLRSVLVGFQATGVDSLRRYDLVQQAVSRINSGTMSRQVISLSKI